MGTPRWKEGFRGDGSERTSLSNQGRSAILLSHWSAASRCSRTSGHDAGRTFLVYCHAPARTGWEVRDCSLEWPYREWSHGPMSAAWKQSIAHASSAAALLGHAHYALVPAWATALCVRRLRVPRRSAGPSHRRPRPFSRSTRSGSRGRKPRPGSNPDPMPAPEAGDSVLP
jgi:hypothetical protein